MTSLERTQKLHYMCANGCGKTEEDDAFFCSDGVYVCRECMAEELRVYADVVLPKTPKGNVIRQVLEEAGQEMIEECLCCYYNVAD